MKRLITFCLFLCCSPAFAATWYATSSSVNINASNLWVPTSTGTCTGSGTALSFGSQANGDIFDANGCTALAVNVDPGSTSVQVTLESNASHGGGFTYATATNITIHANVIYQGGGAITLNITGSTGGGTLSGNVSSTAAGDNAVVTNHTSVTFNLVGNITANGNGVAQFLVNASGPVSVTGNVTGGSATGGYGLEANGGAVTVTGNCIGGTSPQGAACYGINTTNPITLVGSLISGTKQQAAQGYILFTPAATNYALYAKDVSYTAGTINSHATEMPTDPGVSNVLSGVTYGSLTGTLVASTVCAAGSW